MKQTLTRVIQHFQIEGELVSCEPTGNGHINDSYAVCVSAADASRYVVQRINHQVFPDPVGLMQNITRVTDFIRQQLKESGNWDSRRVLTVIPNKDGSSYYKDPEGNYWRVYVMIEDAVSYDAFQNEDQAFKVGEAFGNFQRMLAPLNDPPLNHVIPHFHDGPRRLAAFEEVLAADPHKRAVHAQTEIDDLKAHAHLFQVIPNLFASGQLPMRVTHNDTKVNNVLLDKHSDDVLCVIDLDTVMPGSALFDFGDMIRTGANTGAEDDQDLDRVGLDESLFKAMTRGYLSGAGDMLTSVERDHLFFSARLITLMIGTRFLTDYLAGDTYFKIHRPQHNLERTRAQFKLLHDMNQREAAMVQWVKELQI